EELHDRELEPCQGAAVEDEAGPRHLRGAFEVAQAEVLADLCVLARRIARRLVAPGARTLVVALGSAHRHGPVPAVGYVPPRARGAPRADGAARPDSPPPTSSRACARE